MIVVDFMTHQERHISNICGVWWCIRSIRLTACIIIIIIIIIPAVSSAVQCVASAGCRLVKLPRVGFRGQG
jgi:hypothetical protein